MFSPSNKPAVVYEARNIKSGKRYIGVTCLTLSKRKSMHLCYAAQKRDKGAFGYALRKYGGGAFEWSVLCAYESSADAVAEERRLIARLNPEYNSTAGGQSYHPTIFSEDARRRMAAPHWGNQYRRGKTHDIETRARLRAAGLRDKNKWLERSHLGPQSQARQVLCVSDGLAHESASSAARFYGVAKSALIELCLGKQYRHSVGGRVFRYLEAEDGVPVER